MAREITTTGSKKVSTLMKEFNENFPYLILIIGTIDSNGILHQCDVNKTLSEVRTKKGNGEVSFTGSKNIGTIENEFLNLFGLTIQVAYIDGSGKNFYSGSIDDKTSLTQYNNSRAAAGCKKGVWKWG